MSKENALFPEVNNAIEFDALWQQAKNMTTTLSGNIWTDSSEQDPGITLLQSVTWNCADLSYRTSLSLNDLLTQKNQQTLFPKDFGPDRILTCNTVTEEDYRRLILDIHSTDIQLNTSDQDFIFSDACIIIEPENHRYHWWYNTEKREYSFSQPADNPSSIKSTLRGNLWLSIIPTRYTELLSDEKRKKIDEYLNSLIAEHRNIGELITQINWLKSTDFNPRMTITLSDDISDINKVAAEIFQVTESFLRQTVTRYTTEQQRARGYFNDQIFEGPELQHGWLETTPSQISQKDYTVNLTPLVSKLLAIPGVTSLDALSAEFDIRFISQVAGYNWSYRVMEGYYPLLWGDNPLCELAKKRGPLVLVTKGGIYNQLDSELIANYLVTPKLIKKTPTVLPAGRFLDQTPYVPVGQRLPECYSLQQPNSVINASIRSLHQFLLPVDQMIADGNAQLALLPKLLAFQQRGNSIRGTRWPYLSTAVQQEIHQAYSTNLIDHQEKEVAIFSNQDNTFNQANFFRELDFIQYLLGYFGTQRAPLPLTMDFADFLDTQRAYLAQQPTLGYDRVNIRINQVSALQKRLAARIGLGSACFNETQSMDQLPFYLIEHRQLLPRIPDSSFNEEQKPEKFESNKPPIISIYQSKTAGRIARGQLIDLIAIEGTSKLRVRGLVVVNTVGDWFHISTKNSKQLANNIERFQAAALKGNLRWKNCDVWLQDMDYRLNYVPNTQNTLQKNQRLLMSNAQVPYPSLANVGDVIVISPRYLQLSKETANKKTLSEEDQDWRLEATIKELDPIAGTLLIEKNSTSTKDFPDEDNSFKYQWHFSQSTHASKDKFSFVVSTVFNRKLLANENIVPSELVDWIQKSILAEFPAHVSLVTHWLDEATFKNFGVTYQHWQNNGAPLGDDAFLLMQMLTLGCLPTNQLSIGSMRIANESQHIAVMGINGDEWNSDVILEQELFYIPKDNNYF